MKKKQKPDFSNPKKQSSHEVVTEDLESEDLETEESETPYSHHKSYKGLPTVAIVGRPNVGKSTLFNRFMQRRIAIVDPTPGVTRDPVEGTAFICGKPVHLVDTGGYKLTRDTGSMEAVMDDLVVEKTLSTLKSADKIVLLLEAGNIFPEDEEFIQKVRPFWNKIITAINKTEGGRNEGEAWEFSKFGFNSMIFISALHGDRIPELSEKIIEDLDFSHVSEGVEDNPVKIAILGKPNTGKSTLANRLTHKDASIVSNYAGTTRDVVEGSFQYGKRRFTVLDTAGIRKKGKVTENVEYYSVNRAIKTLNTADIVFLMIDANEGLTEQDKKICALAYEKGRGIIFVLNKWDQQEQDRKTARKAEENIHIMFGHMNYAPIIELSALEGLGIKLLLNTAVEIYEQLNKKIDTATLNIALSDWLAQYPPPASRTQHFSVKYIVQTHVNPVSFLIFATRPEVVPLTYISYLTNRIRQDLGFSKIPVHLEMKASRKRWENRERTT